jgi:hypothetical protein
MPWLQSSILFWRIKRVESQKDKITTILKDRANISELRICRYFQ